MDIFIIDPETTFATIEQGMVAIGLRREADPTAVVPFLPGEPDAASWIDVGSEIRIVYSFHPAIRLRVLTIEKGADRLLLSKLAQVQPQLTNKDAKVLMANKAIESVLLGLHVASALSAIELLDDIAELTQHEDALISAEATVIFKKLVSEYSGIGLRILSEWKVRHPNRSALFLLAGGSRERCQLLRWMMNDQPNSNPHIDQVLATAFGDHDWEVRVTAILVSARLRAIDMGKAIAEAKLPTSTREGVNQDERRIIGAVQQFTLEILKGTPLPKVDGPPTCRESMQAHIIRCMLGLPVKYHDHIFMFISAFCNPLPVEYPLPERLPEGIIAERGIYKLRGHDISLSWIPPIPHWIGEHLPRMRIENPIRCQTPPTGFFMGEHLYSNSPGQQDYSKGVPLTCTRSEAQKICSEISTETGLIIRLPTADEWEMAARGTDGRRFPWGNNALRCKNTRSPWDICDAVGKLAQWTSTETEDGLFIVCGGPKQLVCAQRNAVKASTDRIGLRLLVEYEKE